MNYSNLRVCQQPGCDGPKSGICIENFPLNECPHLITDDSSESESHTVPEEDTDPSAGEYVITSLGATLDSLNCDAFLRRRDALVLAVIAGPEAGKTTLLSTIYELAHRGKIASVEFAGSETILGFEQRCHFSRASSLLKSPDTARTRVNGPQFLHLRLLIEGHYVDLLMADRPGENYTKAIQNPKVLNNYEEIQRANHLLLLVDGKQLATNPHPTAAGARRLFRGMLENELREDQQVHLVITKVDLFTGDGLSSLQGRAEGLWKEFQERAKKHAVHLLMTGARARSGEDSFGEGIHALICGFVKKQDKKKFQTHLSTEDIKAVSMLDQLMHKMAVK